MSDTKMTKEELKKFTAWLDKQVEKCYRDCRMDCSAYVNGAHGSVCVLAKTSYLIDNGYYKRDEDN